MKKRSQRKRSREPPKADSSPLPPQSLPGFAIASTPVKLLGLITIGTTTAVSWPIVAAIGAAGALFGGVSAALLEGHRQQRTREKFTELINDE